jgi:2-polyprenyl-3-methyl-5-hydroxy-6-metoxy-1,4-benzoquinol methylase
VAGASRPLAATGIEVDGTDFSPNAIDLLRAHPHGATVNGTVADMSDFALDRKYRLIYCIGNVLFDVLTQDGEVRCFERVAAHLAPEAIPPGQSDPPPRHVFLCEISEGAR